MPPLIQEAEIEEKPQLLDEHFVKCLTPQRPHSPHSDTTSLSTIVPDSTEQ